MTEDIDVRDSSPRHPGGQVSAVGIEDNRRILVVDDDEAIHEDYKKLLCAETADSEELDALERDLFGDSEKSVASHFTIDSAYQGEEGLECVRRSLHEHRPYALAFIDVRMPPGWDGIKTTARILAEDSDIVVVICSAYSDHSWSEIASALGNTDRVLILRKPFDAIEVRQLAHALKTRWSLARQAAMQIDALESMCELRSQELRSSLKSEQQARERAMQSEKLAAVGQLAAGLAHELNNPLGVILGFAEGMKRRTDDDSPFQLPVTSIVREALRCKTLIQELLSFSRISDAMDDAIDPNALIQSVIVLLTSQAKHRNIGLRQELGSAAPMFSGNRILLQQVLINFGTNALDATTEGGEITFRASQDGQGRACLEVSDTGTGISPSTLQRIFEPFFTTKEVGKGTGLGLALAYDIVKRHSGCIEVSSKEGAGTTLSVHLPVVTPSPAEAIA